MKNLETPGKTGRVGRYERGKKDQPPKTPMRHKNGLRTLLPFFFF